MSTYYYLVRVDNKTLYELGKNNWYSDLEVFKIDKTEKLLPNSEFGEDEEEDSAYLYNFSDKEMLKLAIKEHWDDPECSDEYINYVVNGILNFCDNNNVYIISDCADFYVELKYKQKYTKAGSVYIDK